MTSASRMIERRTCRREAPSVRNVASSRVRWAIVIESEFAITKLPTKRATPAKPSRNFCRNEMNAFVSLASSCACARPVRTSVSLGRIPRISVKSCAVGTFGLDATAISSSLPGFPNRSCAVGRSNPANVAPPIVPTDPNLTMPESLSCWTGPIGLHPDGLADREVLLARGRLVDDDLVALSASSLRPGSAD